MRNEKISLRHFTKAKMHAGSAFLRPLIHGARNNGINKQ